MICTEYNSYIKNLVRSLEMMWIVTLNNGVKVYSDHNNPAYPNQTPWRRLKEHCAENNVFPVMVQALILGAPKLVMAENNSGLDGLFIIRGSSKDFLMESGEGTSYKQLIVGVLSDTNDDINTTKFCWPKNALEPFNEVRQITFENIELMLFKNGSKKRERESVQVALNRAAM